VQTIWYELWQSLKIFVPAGGCGITVAAPAKQCDLLNVLLVLLLLLLYSAQVRLGCSVLSQTFRAVQLLELG
jgi:hypothetical protein